ncbi:MAG: DUF2213 domain-containing protein [Candidatus Hodarchaeales archaeon]
MEDTIKRGEYDVCLRKLKSVGFNEEEAKILCAHKYYKKDSIAKAREISVASRANNISLSKYATIIKLIKIKKTKPEAMSLEPMQSELPPKNLNKLQTKMEKQETEEEKFLTAEELLKRAKYATLMKKQDSYLVYADAFMENIQTGLRNIIKFPVTMAKEMIQTYDEGTPEEVYHFKPYKELKGSIKGLKTLPIIIEHADEYEEDEIVGYVKEMKGDGEKRSIKGMAYLTEGKLPKIVLDALKANKVFPVSIGFYADLGESGSFLGQRYDATQKNIILNHLAICIDSIPRCPEDQCGLNRDSIKDSEMPETTIIKRKQHITNISNYLEIMEDSEMTDTDMITDYDKTGHIAGDEPKDFFGALARLRKFMVGDEVIEPTKKYWNRYLQSFRDDKNSDKLDILLFVDSKIEEDVKTMSEEKDKEFQDAVALKDAEIEKLKKELEDSKEAVEKIKKDSLIEQLKEVAPAGKYEDSELEGMCSSELGIRLDSEKKNIPSDDAGDIETLPKLNDSVPDELKDRINPENIFEDVAKQFNLI